MVMELRLEAGLLRQKSAPCARVGGMTDRDIPRKAQDTLARLAKASDRTSPTVFAGRGDEINLLNDAVDGVQHDESGHTVVIQGVPGAGKTSLLNEYAARLLAANSESDRLVVPVPLQPAAVNQPPLAIIHEIDRAFSLLEKSNEWRRAKNRAFSGTSFVGHALFTATTRKRLDDFRPSARSPTSLPAALDDYTAFRFDRRESTIVLLVDEAQNLRDTGQVREHLGTLHSGVKGRVQVLLACFGLASTQGRLRELGLSRLATGHVRSIGALSDEHAKETVAGTLEVALADVEFDEGERRQWIMSASAAILAGSANFPHHLANGCRALAEIALDEGIGDEPPVQRLREQCRAYRREYYDARLQPWANHTVALAHVLGGDGVGWVPLDRVMDALMSSDNRGRAVSEETAASIVDGLSASGDVDERHGQCRAALPSLASHFEEVRRDAAVDTRAVQAIRAAVT